MPVSELGDGSGLRIVQRLNGELFQDGNTSDLVFGVRRLVAHASNVFTLEPGDLILTGTPSGIGHTRNPPVSMKAGDVVEIEIEGIGVLRNPVVAESARARRSRSAPLGSTAPGVSPATESRPPPLDAQLAPLSSSRGRSSALQHLLAIVEVSLRQLPLRHRHLLEQGLDSRQRLRDVAHVEEQAATSSR